MDFENKIGMVIVNNLLSWQKLNVASFLASSIAIKFPETHGAPFINASESEYLPFIKQPILIYTANNSEEIKRAFERAKARELHIGIYTKPLFSTKNEAQNHIEIKKCGDIDQQLVGIVIYGDKRKTDKALNGLKLHP